MIDALLPTDLGGLLRLIGLAPTAARATLRARLLPPLDPIRTVRLLRVLQQYGTTPALGFAAGAARHPNDVAVIDCDTGSRTTFAEMEDRTNALRQWLTADGYRPGVVVGLLGRNSRAYLDAIAAVSRTGADLVYLNTGHTADQISAIADREGISRYLVAAEFTARTPAERTTVLGGPEWESMATRSTTAAGRPPKVGRHIILTSGTTGVPRGAARDSAPIDAAIALLAGFPFRQRDTHVIAAPLFHAWAWLNHRFAALLDSTQVLLPTPDPQAVLAAAARHRANTIITVPVVVQRMLGLPESAIESLDLSELRVVAVSGSALPPTVVTAFADRFGPVLYNLYGSTEAAFATLATPSDLAADPASAGRPLPGVAVAVLDEHGDKAPTGQLGRVYVGSSTSFAGYTDGSDRDRVDGMLWTGDLGQWDESGRLRIAGRDDDVIISGGENVHPVEVEAVLRQHPDVADVVVTGRTDPEYGQAIVAHVVLQHPVAAGWNARFLAWARTRLAPAQRPVEVRRRQSIPRNATGKIQRSAMGGTKRTRG